MPCPLSYSQQGEDLVFLRYFWPRGKTGGKFVEIGAYDGITYSNTKLLEDNHQFTGFLLEPDPGLYKKLTVNRPRATCLNVAVSNVNTPSRFSQKGAESKISETGAIFVNRRPFSHIQREQNITNIDFLVIDVEGHELEVLEGIDWKTLGVGVVCIELDGKRAAKDVACRQILWRNGFSMALRLGINEFWWGNLPPQTIATPVIPRNLVASVLPEATRWANQHQFSGSLTFPAVKVAFPFLEAHLREDVFKTTALFTRLPRTGPRNVVRYTTRTTWPTAPAP